MKDLLKQAIADAKAVRETALANAKLALEEAFTPRLQSMLSAKLAEEMEGEEEEMTEEEEVETHEEAPVEAEESEEAPVEEGDDMEAEEEMEEGEEMEAEDDLDLEEIIRELEGEDEPAMEEGDDMESEEAPVAEAEGEDEEVNIEEIVRALREEDEEEMNEEEHEEEVVEENEDHEAELEEAYNVIRFLKGKINEVNLLNAKLLYSNKLFRNFSLNESQKMKVIENFDRAYNLREVKLVFSTLAESFKNSGTKKIVKESFASKPIASTKPAKQVLSEGHELAERFKKLAGLNKRK